MAQTGTNSSRTFCHTMPIFYNEPVVSNIFLNWQPPSIKKLELIINTQMRNKSDIKTVCPEKVVDKTVSSTIILS